MNEKDFEKIIAQSDGSRGETMEIYYSDGTIVEGFVQRVHFDLYSGSYTVNLCKSAVPRGESSDHNVRFDKIKKLVVKPYGQEPNIYE